MIEFYLPSNYVLDKFEEYNEYLRTQRHYPEVAESAFEYACLLSSIRNDEKAKEKYIEGIYALTAYGYDRTLDEILYSYVPYQQAYGTLSVERFYELYQMAITVVAHTDDRSTKGYPIEWFKEFIKVYPEKALMFLASKTLESEKANWFQEEQFHHILKECVSFFTATQWFLLCRSLPLASSEKIISYGLKVSTQVDDTLQDTFSRWLETRPLLAEDKEKTKYSQEVVTQFKEKFGIHLKLKKQPKTWNVGQDNGVSSKSSQFPTASVTEAFSFLENQGLQEYDSTNIQKLIASINDWEERKRMLRRFSKSFDHWRNYGEWVKDIFEPKSQEFLYFNICLFVFIKYNHRGLYFSHYLKTAYETNSSETINMLREILGYFFVDIEFAFGISGNLIRALSELQVEKSIVENLFNVTFQIIKNRLPHPPDSAINESIYNGLKGLNRDEMVVALLIARLKTLTTEKTQGIIWSLTYIAKSTPKTLMKPFYWAFSHPEFLLPIHRTLLLQILKEYVKQDLIPDELIDQLIINYPTGFFFRRSIHSLIRGL